MMTVVVVLEMAALLRCALSAGRPAARMLLLLLLLLLRDALVAVLNHDCNLLRSLWTVYSSHTYLQLD